MSNKPNIINIPSNYHFLESLFTWVLDNFSSNLSEIKIFLPNRRSCREFSKLFLDSNLEVFLPKIKAISDLSFEDFFDFTIDDEVKDAIENILKTSSKSKLEHLISTAKEIQNLSLFGENIEFYQAIKIAINLNSLFDDIEFEGIDFIKISEIDDSNLSKHRQITLDFVKSLYVKIKNSSIKQDKFFTSETQGFITKEFTKLLNKNQTKNPIIIAGSSGSISFVKDLIKAISKENYVILYGLKNEEFEDENHPQFFLNQLIKYLEIDKKEILDLKNDQFLLSNPNRQKLLSIMNLPSQEIFKWQELENLLNIKEAKEDLEKNFSLIEAKNEIEEAKIIALISQESFLNNKKTAIIANSDNCANLITLELAALNLEFNDTRSFSIFNSKLINFILLIIEFIENEFDSHNFLTILKHPLCKISNQNIIKEFEIKILRQDRLDKSLLGVKLKLENEIYLKEFFEEFIKIFSNFTNKNLSSQINSIIKIIEQLNKNSWQNLLILEDAQVEIFELFEKLKNYQDIEIDKNSLSLTYKTIFSQINYFKKTNSNLAIQILSPIEARLLNYDLIIVASLNEGNFPKIESQNWLGKKIKKDLGIDKSLRKIGQNAYDFCNYLSNKSVTLTRSKSSNDEILIESPFLLKFKTICKKINVNINNGEKYFAYLKQKNSPEIHNIFPPNPKPAIELRPKNISITDITKLIDNPYEIYIKKVLQLKKLNKIDFEPEYAEFGSFVHKALEEFIKYPDEKVFLEKIPEIFRKYFLSKDSELIWLPKFENIFKNFLKENEKFLKYKNYVEISANIKIEDILIKGKIDRIIINENEAIDIFDYKTGQIASKKDVELGIDPQLTIAALMLIEGMIDSLQPNLELNNKEIASLNYWKLSSSSESEIKNICNKNEEIKILIQAAKIGLKNLFEYFANQENGYVATKSEKQSDYINLIRKDEWLY